MKTLPLEYVLDEIEDLAEVISDELFGKLRDKFTKAATDSDEVDLYLLQDYDGGDGRGNRNNGLIVKSKALAEAWAKRGDSYIHVQGIIVNDLREIKDAQDKLLRQKALSRLTPDEKRVLGLL